MKWNDLMFEVIGKMDNFLTEEKRAPEVKEEEMLKKAINKAGKELLVTRSFFDNVTDPDMVDHAIYAMQAAERKYAYLLKFAREKGYRQPLKEALLNNISGEEG